jgi:hypothetical protein
VRLRVTALVLLPLAVLVGGGALMTALTHRSRATALWKRADDPAQRSPVNQRFRGYSTAELEQQWKVLDREMLANERRFLRMDLVFPLLYGGALLVSLLGIRRLGVSTPSVMVFVGCVGATMIADWVENVSLLQQLARFERELPLVAGAVRVASTATIIKLGGFSVAYLLVLYAFLATMMRRS